MNRTTITVLSLAVGLLVPLSGPATAGAGAEVVDGGSHGSGWREISGGYAHTCGTQTDHTLWCWGWNRFGQLGVGDRNDRSVPTQVGDRTDWAGLKAGDSHTCATRTDHSLWCWGRNRFGQLGLGDTTRRKVPTQVGTSTDWAYVSAGGYGHTCGTRTDGSLWCWGLNGSGQLGLGDTTDRTTPTQVGTRTDLVGVGAGDSHTCATATDHSLWCWGSNVAGQLGLGDTTDRTTPTQVGTDTDWIHVSAANGFHSCATRSDQTLWCWGYNGQAQLGLGISVVSNRFVLIPTRVGTGADWSTVSAGHRQTCGTRSDRTLWCWGHNFWGQLGVGDTTLRTTPTRVGSDANWAVVSSGGHHTCGIRTDHTAWCWGWNFNGQLGVGDQVDRLVPAQVI